MIKGIMGLYRDENEKGVALVMSLSPQQSDDNTYILDTESAAEMARLISVDQFTTRGMGGPLAEQPDPSVFSKIF